MKFYLEYFTDTNAQANIVVDYLTDINQRLSIGGFNPNASNTLMYKLGRKDLSPRYVIHNDLGKIFFRTKSDMDNYYLANLNDICRIQNESFNRRAILAIF